MAEKSGDPLKKGSIESYCEFLKTEAVFYD